jgi:hypothetical protein
MGIDLDKILDPKRILSICLLVVVLTVCSVFLTKNDTQVDFLGVKITKVETPMDPAVLKKMMEGE